MKISYCVSVCNELVEIMKLVESLTKNKKQDDEIVILFDSDKGSKKVEEYLRALTVASKGISWHSAPLNRDFATFKNNFFKYASGDFIVQIDADEIPSEEFYEWIHYALEQFDCDMMTVARKNIVNGITQDHINKWRWSVIEEDGNYLINYPDFQSRVVRNNGQIKWENKVHEQLKNYKSFATLPANMFLWHIKDIERQEIQNNFYESI